MARRCKHVRAVAIVMINVMTYECRTCGARGVRNLGPSNDADMNIEYEMAAAAIAAQVMTGDWSMTNAEDDGYDGIEDSPFASLAAWHIGWCASEATHDVDSGWAWGITRPIAEQLAETARVDAEALAMEAGAVRQLSEPGAVPIDLDALEATQAADIDPFAVNVPGDFNGTAWCHPGDRADAALAPVDPMTKFGHIAQQIAVPVTTIEPMPAPKCICGKRSSDAAAALAGGWSMTDGEWWCPDWSRINGVAS